jgi:hypothetical protein
MPQVYYVNLVINNRPLFVSIYVARLNDSRELRVERGRLAMREDLPPAEE